jgi:hypothetical protein
LVAYLLGDPLAVLVVAVTLGLPWAQLFYKLAFVLGFELAVLLLVGTREFVRDLLVAGLHGSHDLLLVAVLFILR